MTLEAEQACIGGVAIGGPTQDAVMDNLLPEHFLNEQCRNLFIAAYAVRTAGHTPDLITIGAAAEPKVNRAIETLSALADFAPAESNTDVYIDIVKTTWMRHKLAEAASKIKSIAQEGSSAEELVESATACLTPLSDKAASVGFRHIAAASKEFIFEMATASKSGAKLTGLSTGFSRIDAMTGGLQKGDLIVVGGRPSHGKTATAMAIAHHVAQNNIVQVFSCEMAIKQLAMRSVSMFSQIDFDRIKNAQVSKSDGEALSDAQKQHERRELYVDDRSNISIAQLRSRAKAQARKTGCDLIIVDYLTLVSGVKENRIHEVSEVSAGLKGLAKEIDCPVIAIAQLSRGCEQRPDKRPIPSDLRDSGTIEQDADIIAFCYLDEKYNEDSPRAGIQEFIIRKQRQGPTGSVYLDFDGSRQTITQRNAPVPELAGKAKRRSFNEL
ncbi:replicative DNA helicase [uncultured Paraglaciecola sp.]|uniref:replicative DNA helicase n=1 Tax=uncultured Paraglaciecola sp. TaxID=1765024 RepID=UPI002617D3CB|nr:replicative DNA helicase [uncultured Paraglaciecola sp.]